MHCARVKAASVQLSGNVCLSHPKSPGRSDDRVASKWTPSSNGVPSQPSSSGIFGGVQTWMGRSKSRNAQACVCTELPSLGRFLAGNWVGWVPRPVASRGPSHTPLASHPLHFVPSCLATKTNRLVRLHPSRCCLSLLPSWIVSDPYAKLESVMGSVCFDNLRPSKSGIFSSNQGRT